MLVCSLPRRLPACSLEWCPSGDAYLKSAHLGATDVLKSGLRVGRATPAGTLELVVSPFGASVEGTVTKAQTPIPGAYVGVEMTNTEEGRRSANTETQTDQYGHFAFHALAPGEYTFSVCEDQQSAGMHTIKVGLNEGQHSTVSVRLDSAE
jgi:Carboxypeptidase regulatory-like domain